MFCTNCGAKVEPGSRFCTNCGADLAAQNVDAGSEGPVGANAGPGTTPVADPTMTQPWTPQEAQAAAPTPAYERPSGNREGKTGLVVAIVVAVCAVVVIAVAVVTFFVVPGCDSDSGGSGSKGSQVEASRDESDSDDGNSDESESEEETTEHVGFKGVSKAGATSTLATDRISNYYATNVLDGDPTTCWSEGVDGLGIGESITLSGMEVQTFSGFTLTNGYQKTEDIYYNNPRPTKIAVSVDGAYVMEVEPSDSYGTSVYYALPEPVDGTTITFTIEDAVAGSKYEDTSISDIIVS